MIHAFLDSHHYTKKAAVCFLLGKMTSVPAVIFLFAAREYSLTLIIIYATLITLSISYGFKAIAEEKKALE